MVPHSLRRRQLLRPEEQPPMSHNRTGAGSGSPDAKASKRAYVSQQEKPHFELKTPEHVTVVSPFPQNAKHQLVALFPPRL